MKSIYFTLIKHGVFLFGILILACSNPYEDKAGISDEINLNEDSAIKYFLFDRHNQPVRPRQSNQNNYQFIQDIWLVDSPEIIGPVKLIIERGISINSVTEAPDCGTLIERVVQKSRVQMDSSQYIYSYFNENKWRTKEEIYTNKMKLYRVTSYQFDNLGSINEMAEKDYDGGDPFNLRYIKNSSSQIVEERIAGYSQYNRYYYDSSNYLIKEEERSLTDTLLYVTSYWYDDKGNLVLTLTKSAEGKTMGYLSLKYNELSQVVERDKFSLIFISCSGRNKWKYKYNQAGLKVEEKTYDLTVRNVYEFDEWGNWIKKSTFYNDDVEPNLVRIRKISYY